MDSQHRIMRATVGIAITKALKDIETDSKRAVRNLVDLGTMFANGEHQKKFFELANDVIANPQNPYNKILLELTRNVDPRIIKKICTNLGYSSLVYGVKQLRDNLDRLHCRIPWLIVFHMERQDGFEEISCPAVGSMIGQGREMGIYSYLFSLSGGEGEKAQAILKLAEKFYDCFFLIALPAELVTEDFARQVRETANVAVSVSAESEDGTLPDDCARAFNRLHEQQCMFGYHTMFQKENFDAVTGPAWMNGVMESHCLFGCYLSAAPEDTELSERMHAFSCATRGGNGKSILTFEYSQDSRFFNQSISPESGILRVNGAGQVLWNDEVTGRSAKDGDLLRILKEITPEAAAR